MSVYVFVCVYMSMSSHVVPLEFHDDTPVGSHVCMYVCVCANVGACGITGGLGLIFAVIGDALRHICLGLLSRARVCVSMYVVCVVCVCAHLGVRSAEVIVLGIGLCVSV